jgi:hypothetical protein
MTTDLRPLIAAKIDELGRPVRDRIMKWRFFNANGVETTKADGSSVSIRGVKYAGTVPLIFWSGFFEPFMTNAASGTLKWVKEHCREDGIDPSPFLDEARELLHDFVRKTYAEIAKTDQLLRGEGFPDSVEPRNVADKQRAMCDYVDQLAKAYRLGQPIRNSATGDIIELKPNVYGFGIDLRAAWRHWRAKRAAKKAPGA